MASSQNITQTQEKNRGAEEECKHAETQDARAQHGKLFQLAICAAMPKEKPFADGTAELAASGSGSGGWKWPASLCTVRILWLYSHTPGAKHKDVLVERISVRIHAAHVFAPGQMQETTPGEFFMYWFRARGNST